MKTLKFTLASALAFALTACAGEAPDDTSADKTAIAQEAVAAGNIVQVAQGDEAFSNLVDAVTAAQLDKVLVADGPFTVFAPTNDAFAKLPEGTLEKLSGEDVDTLTAILHYHVVEGAIDAGALIEAINEAGDEDYFITTVSGGTLTAKIVEGAIVLSDAAGNSSTIITTDVEASNGLIHVIDTVLMPQ